ncbi:MAG: 2,3-bisphosphoglycerate-independent phosphoglycerate mutase [Alphaproteobacteria bacterium]|jgi:2,3-bisphosphoglycerate-independent phosphoglycerate mutase|nr:2,3-bisphosphoglycerate-independent phosphoglycerate mutase [Alphaproteobacteria bacterium]MBP9777256.1 2,3-bisphosphoglycerate-independent phosphoglycerate mutase [Alphaproteobacteria bacterium]
MTKAVVLCILDGWGHRENGSDNAIAHAKTPHWDHCLAHSPHTLLEASELNVGLPKDQMGNSEVGHMNIGAGRVILQDLPRIDEAIANDTLKSLPSLKDFIKILKKTKGTCHLLGLLSSGGVHSHEHHVKALAAIIAHEGIPVAVHAFLDGRDTPPKSAEQSLASFQKFMQEHPGIFLASVGGRYYAMDRDHRWDRIQKAYEPMTEGKPDTHDTLSYLQESYTADLTDEFVIPTAISPYQGMKDGDGLFMANFRADRVRQILTAFLDPQFKNFSRPHRIKFSTTLGFTDYSEILNQWMGALFPSTPLDDVLGSILSRHGLNQLRLAETEKYAHVTFFFNGGREEVFPGEDRILIPSPLVATYDLKPEMSAHELTDCLVEAIESQKYALIVVNYANADMVGHTGNFAAAQKAIETIDLCLGRMNTAVKKTDACLLLTADHGNAEMMYDETLKSPHTAHTTNPVPFIMVNGPTATLHHGKLCDIAPTILQILDLPQPSSMTGCSLLELRYG